MNKKALKLFYFLLLFAICYLPSAFLFAAEPVTKVTAVVLETLEGQQTAAITLNDKLVIREIKITRAPRSGIITLFYPEYISRQERAIPQVVIENQKLGEEIKKAIADQNASREKAVDIVYKIAKIVPYKGKDSPVRGFVKILFNSVISVEARIMDSGSGLWIAWPGRKTRKGTWIKQFDIASQPLKKAIEKAILDKYAIVISEEP
ncbi:MAG: septation protein SpoVG family protein [bacterium]|nr:septation protein SpoVG family protein [bacterium]